MVLWAVVIKGSHYCQRVETLERYFIQINLSRQVREM